MSLSVTGYKNVYDNIGYSKDLTWEHFASKMQSPHVVAEKKAAPLFSPTIYLSSLDGYKKIGEHKNKKGKIYFDWKKGTKKALTDQNNKILRANVNVLGISMLVFDYDSGKAKAKAIWDTWKDYNMILHSTWSHTAESGKYRLIIPLKKMLTAEEFKLIWEDVRQMAGDIDISCKDPSRMFYWPSCKPENQGIHDFWSQSDKKFYAPKVKRIPKRKIKRGDYKTLDAVKWFSDHGHYLGPANKADQHWVKCPWQGEHAGKTGDTDAVMWNEPNQWPTFSCSHNSCKQAERNITQVMRVWPDADQYCGRALTRDVVKTDTEIKCLGYDDSGYYYYQSSKNNHVVRLKTGEHKELNFYGISADGDYWFKHWGKEDTGRIDWKTCAMELIGKCHKAGFFKPSSVRGGGCWADKGRIIVHSGSHLRVGDEKIGLTEIQSDYIYEAAVQEVKLRAPLSDSEAKKIYAIISSLPVPSRIERVLLSGHTVTSILSGCLRWRPHIWMVGDAGSGKTAILNYVLNPLWAPVGGIMSEGRTTEAGVRQKVRHSAVPIIVDELESHSKDDEMRVQALIQMARSASSNSDGDVLKGTISGQGMSFLIRSCITFSSISQSLEWAQDKERFCIISVKGTESSKKTWPARRKMIESTITKEYALSFYSRAVKLAPIIRVNADIFAEAIIDMFPAATSRNADQISTILAGFISLNNSNEINLSRAKQIITNIASDKEWSRFWEKDETNSPMNAIAALLSCILRGDKSTSKSIGELVEECSDPVMMGAGDRLPEAQLLMRYGLKVEEGSLWISKTHPQTKTLFRQHGISGHYGLISLIPEAQHDSIRFGTMKSKAVGLDLKLVLS